MFEKNNTFEKCGNKNHFFCFLLFLEEDLPSEVHSISPRTLNVNKFPIFFPINTSEYIDYLHKTKNNTESEYSKLPNGVLITEEAKNHEETHENYLTQYLTQSNSVKT